MDIINGDELGNPCDSVSMMVRPPMTAPLKLSGDKFDLSQSLCVRGGIHLIDFSPFVNFSPGRYFIDKSAIGFAASAVYQSGVPNQNIYVEKLQKPISDAAGAPVWVSVGRVNINQYSLDASQLNCNQFLSYDYETDTLQAYRIRLGNANMDTATMQLLYQGEQGQLSMVLRGTPDTGTHVPGMPTMSVSVLSASLGLSGAGAMNNDVSEDADRRNVVREAQAVKNAGQEAEAKRVRTVAQAAQVTVDQASKSRTEQEKQIADLLEMNERLRFMLESASRPTAEGALGPKAAQDGARGSGVETPLAGATLTSEQIAGIAEVNAAAGGDANADSEAQRHPLAVTAGVQAASISPAATGNVSTVHGLLPPAAPQGSGGTIARRTKARHASD